MADDNRSTLLRQELEKRILVLDGAMGTMLQSFGLEEKDFRKGFFENHSRDLKGNNDVLCLTRPDAVRTVHVKYLEAGADIIETNTFNSNAVSQADYLLQDRVYELNRAGASIARAAADEFTKADPEKPRFVAGTIGPTGRTLSMSPDVNNPAFRNLTFDELADTCRTAAEGLIDGGADILLIETIFDTLNAKAAAFGVMLAQESRGKRLPVMFSGTLSDASGRLLAGQNVEAFLISILHTPNLLSVGFNCALGAAEMHPHLAELAGKCPHFVSAHPNAGLPDELGRYRQSPEEMGRIIRGFAEEGLLNIVGGCCGTTPAHIGVIAEAVRNCAPRRIPVPEPLFRASGLDPLIGTRTEEGPDPAGKETGLRAEKKFLHVGERTNVAGSRKFLNLIRAGNYPEAVHIARSQVENGAQMIDVNMDDALLHSSDCMKHFLLYIASEPEIARVPVMIDSSRWEVILEGLKCVQGKCVVNSISLKEGEAPFLQKAREARRFGAALLCMAFDESGQADTMERRVEVCRRMYRLLTEKAGVPGEDIIFDPNVFAVATGMKEHDNYAVDFIESVRRIHAEMPLCHLSGGISNVSFSFRGNEAVRRALHCVFLHHAVAAGLDMAIVNPAQLAVYDELEPELRSAAEDVILNRSPDAADRLLEIASGLKEKTSAGKDASSAASGRIPEWRNGTLEERLAAALVRGDDSFLEADMKEAAAIYPDPVRILEGPLMEGMRRVGVLFGEGKMFLPQVVKTARVMKQAAAFLLPGTNGPDGEKSVSSLPGGAVSSFAGTVVLATVKGDVHDIGKNIVGVVLRCNNYRVVDLGVMTPKEVILEAALREKADMIGLSGLITPSLEEMSRVAAEMERLGMKIPLLVGGAAASKTHTALKIQPNYSGPVVYVKDASQSVPVANALLNPEKRGAFLRSLEEEYDAIRRKHREQTGKDASPGRILSSSEKASSRQLIDFRLHPSPAPKHCGVFTIRSVSPEELTAYIDWRGLLRAWDLRGGPEGENAGAGGGTAAGKAGKELLADAEKMLEELLKGGLLRVEGRVGIFPAESSGEGIRIFADGKHEQLLADLAMLRRGSPSSTEISGRDLTPNYSLADFLAPQDSGVKDHIGLFALSAGYGVEELSQQFMESGDDYSAILLKCLADRLAEAFSEYLHRLVRRELWGYAPGEDLSPRELFAMKYSGIRPAPGYPACPDHSLKREIFKLLSAEKEIGVSLTESFMMNPPASLCGFYFSHPESRYFNVGKLDEPSLEEYARRRGFGKDAMRAFLGGSGV